MIFRFFIVILLLFPFLTNNYAEILNNNEIAIVSAYTPPYYYLDKEDNIFKGIEVEMISKILNDMNIKYKFYEVRWNEALKNTENGTYFMLSHVLEVSKKNENLYISDPLFNRNLTFYGKKEMENNFKKIENVVNYKVGVAYGYGLEDILPFKLKNIKNIKAKNYAITGLLKVCLSEIDFFLCDENICTDIIEKRIQSFPELKELKSFGTIKSGKFGIRIAMTRNNIRSRTLINEFNIQLEKFKKSVDYKVMISKYNVQVE